MRSIDEIEATRSLPPIVELAAGEAGAAFSLQADANRAGTQGVSIIIPVHNATATLEATLNSVVHQTYALWEAIIVDDGSTDRTGAMAKEWADRDRRFHVHHQKKLGVSAARNRGLREARYPFVLFLDGDDRLATTHLDLMAGALTANSSLDAVHCGWQHILPSGAAGRPHLGSDETDLFRHFAFHCHFAIHACVLRRDLALAVGGFDTSLMTCEDWDFFQRVARTGARFGRVPEVLAFYHLRANSASKDRRRLLTDARVVLDRGHGRDPRMRIAAQVHAEGRNPAHRNLALNYLVTYLGAEEIGAGRTGLDLLDTDDFPPAPDLLPEVVANIIQEPLPTSANRSEQDWPALWGGVNAPLAAFLARVEAQTRAPALAFATLRHLEKKILLADPEKAPLLLGSTYRVNVDLGRRITDVFLPPEADRLICRLTLKGKPIGEVELPGTDVVTGRRIARATLEGRRRLLLLLLLRTALTPGWGLYIGLAIMRNLLRRRTLRLLYEFLAAKPKLRLSAARRVTHEVASVIRANLSRVLSTQPGLAAGRAERRWQKYLDTVAASGRAHPRELIDTQSLNERDRVFTLPNCMGPMTPVAEVAARRQGRPPLRFAAERACAVPILMYHRIAAEGPIRLERYRVAPDLFADQLAAVHRAGYRTVRLEDWISAIVRREPLTGKPVIFTFDDGYRDFLTAAMPVLRSHGFSATVFLVAERIGGFADWDAEYGESAPLLSWEEVRVLQEIGVEFGCHSSLHRPMTGMHLTELADDTVRARAILEEGLAAPVTTLAYPHGAVNEFVRCVIADLGFRAALTCEPGISRLGDDVMRLRRIEVPGGCTPGRLLSLINHTSEHASP